VDATRRTNQALSVGILADLREDLVDGRLDPSIGPVAAIRADPLDDGGGPVGFVADLVLDLVNDALDMAGQIGLAG
jgi:hypothetical protein